MGWFRSDSLVFKIRLSGLRLSTDLIQVFKLSNRYGQITEVYFICNSKTLQFCISWNIHLYSFNS